MKKKRFKNGKPKKVHPAIVRKEPSYPTLPERIENALINGNLASLAPEERIQLYMQTCKSLKLNPLTKPFGYILVQGWGEDGEKLILYATRNCTDQLRSIYGASDVPGSLKRSETATELTAEIAVVGRNGRVSTDVGVIPLKQFSRKRGEYTLSGRDLANAKMHVVTKARRRATLALYGLGGIVDEAELDTMNVVGGVTREGRIWRYAKQLPEPERELVEYGDYPKGSPRSKEAEEQLRKVEALDREFASGRQQPAESAQSAPASKPAQSTSADGGRSGETPRQSVQSAKASGDPPRSPEAPKTPGKPQDASKTGDSDIPRFLRKTVSEQPQTTANESSKPNPVPKARIPHEIKAVRWTKGAKGLEVELDTGHKCYTFRDSKMDEKGTKLFDLLLNSVGKLAIFMTKMEKNFFHIERVLRLGDREWLEDGTPVLRREPATPMREPGEE
jgi:hypothetical protein